MKKWEKEFKKQLTEYMESPVGKTEDIEELENKILVQCKMGEKEAKHIIEERPKKKKRVLKVAGIVAICIVSFFVIIIGLPQTTWVNALRFDVQQLFSQLFSPENQTSEGIITKTFDNFGDMDKNYEEFSFPRPLWVPENYRLNSILIEERAESQVEFIQYRYIKGQTDNEYIEINMKQLSANEAPSQFSSQDGFDIHIINGISVAITDSEQSDISANFIFQNRFIVNILSSDLHLSEIVKMIENFS